jgi:hypothetical protein
MLKWRDARRDEERQAYAAERAMTRQIRGGRWRQSMKDELRVNHGFDFMGLRIA